MLQLISQSWHPCLLACIISGYPPQGSKDPLPALLSNSSSASLDQYAEFEQLWRRVLVGFTSVLLRIHKYTAMLYLDARVKANIIHWGCRVWCRLFYIHCFQLWIQSESLCLVTSACWQVKLNSWMCVVHTSQAPQWAGPVETVTGLWIILCWSFRV